MSGKEYPNLQRVARAKTVEIIMPFNNWITHTDVLVFYEEALVAIYDPKTKVIHYYPFRALVHIEMTEETSGNILADTENELALHEKFKLGKSSITDGE